MKYVYKSIKTVAWDFGEPTKDVTRDRGFDVYELLGDSDTPIRVGCSINLSSRLYDYKKQVRTYYPEIISETKAVKVYRFATLEMAETYERYLIAKFKPKYNIEGVTKGHTYDNRPRADVYMLRAA